MTDGSGAERQKRYRRHRAGDHLLCAPDRCPDAGSVTASAPSPVTLVTPVEPGPVALAVAEALTAAEVPDMDAGAVELARRYAELIDEAAVAATYVEPLAAMRHLVDEFGSAVTDRHLRKIEAALSAHTVASDLGPKLLAALTALGMTAAGRGVKGGTPDASPVASKLDELGARRAGRGAR